MTEFHFVMKCSLSTHHLNQRCCSAEQCHPLLTFRSKIANLAIEIESTSLDSHQLNSPSNRPMKEESSKRKRLAQN